jgi:hypothetical protein
MVLRGTVGLVAMLVFAGASAAKPGELVDTLHNEDAPLTVLDVAAAQPCGLKTGLCVAAGARSTVAVSSAPVATATTVSNPGKAAPVVPRFQRFSRAASTASSDGAGSSTDTGDWTLEISGVLKRAAWNGNAVFLFFDVDDPDALQNRQFTAIYQAPVKAGPKLAARVSLSPDDGFRAGHTYRIRIVQLINGREIVLAESDVSLL